MLWSSPEYKAMQLRRNRLVFRASYDQPQFSTMTERRHNQWAGKQAPVHCPMTVLIASRKTVRLYIYMYSMSVQPSPSPVGPCKLSSAAEA